MRMHPFHRTELLVGGEGWSTLQGASVCVIGLGGVGSFAAEALARSGVGHLTIVDFDSVCLTNLNRQLHATRSTVGKSKAALMGDRIRDIAPKIDLRVLPLFYDADTAEQVLDRRYDMVLDCIDNMAAKLDLLQRCHLIGQPVIAAMGAGGRLDPTRVHTTPLSETHTCPFARIVRERLRVLAPDANPMVVWSSESPNTLDKAAEEGFRCICPDRQNSPHSCDRRFQVQGSVAWMPPIFGMTMAGAACMQMLDRPVQSQRVVKGGHQRMKPSRDKISNARKRALLQEAGFKPVDVGGLKLGR
ncbi:MAG: tRNA threonylcarbamoyladenosine dehydratase [Myxococcota bacterium]